MGNQLVICTQSGNLHRIGWDGRIEKSSAFSLFEVPIANDMLPESRGLHIKCTAPLYAFDLECFLFVLGLLLQFLLLAVLIHVHIYIYIQSIYTVQVY